MSVKVELKKYVSDFSLVACVVSFLPISCIRSFSVICWSTQYILIKVRFVYSNGTKVTRLLLWVLGAWNTMQNWEKKHWKISKRGTAVKDLLVFFWKHEQVNPAMSFLPLVRRWHYNELFAINIIFLIWNKI